MPTAPGSTPQAPSGCSTATDPAACLQPSDTRTRTLATRIGVDIGGTFTDLVLSDAATGNLVIEKVLTTPDAPERAVLEGIHLLLEAAGASPSDVRYVTHGTTLVTNSLIERKGSRTALVTSQGFRDVLEIGNEGRYDLGDLSIELPVPLAPRRLRLEVPERILQDGTVQQPLDTAAVEDLARELERLGVESVAICFLHSYANPGHEQAVAETLRAALPGVYISLSSEVSPEIREYERTSTTVANAYVGPVMERYTSRLVSGLEEAGLESPLYVMLSAGGLTTPDTAMRFPIRLLESGPAAGAILAAHFGAREDVTDLLSFDMGGTTAKACVITRGRPLTAPMMEVARVWRFKKGSGMPVSVPVVDMIEIGAGGGSIARVNTLGAVAVGPDSAGAAPGPICYGRGGTEPTVTDADLILGYLDPEYFLGGSMALDVDGATAGLARLGSSLGLDAIETAWWVFRVVAENMASAARVHAAERAVDLRTLPLFAFGGAGPVHAVGVARLLRSPSVMIPRAAGVGSALGFLVAPLGFELSRTIPGDIRLLDLDRVREVVEAMVTDARNLVERAGVSATAVEIAYRCTLRHIGQGFAFEVSLPDPSEWTADALDRLFRDRYAELHGGIVVPGVGVEAMTWRVAASTALEDLRLPETKAGPEPEPKAHRPIFRIDTERMESVPVFERSDLAPGWRHEGPLIIEERESTIVAPLACEVHVTEAGSVLVTGF